MMTMYDVVDFFYHLLLLVVSAYINDGYLYSRKAIMRYGRKRSSSAFPMRSLSHFSPYLRAFITMGSGGCMVYITTQTKVTE